MDMTELQRIGLTEGEIKVYDALLELGETTRTELAKKSGVSPSKIYDVANRLLEKGVISSVKKNGIIHFNAAAPEQLARFVEQKEEELRKERALVEQLLPALRSRYEETQERTDVEVFYGWEGMRTVFDEKVRALGPDESDCIFGASRGVDERQADIFFTNYYRAKRRKEFGTRIIFNEDMRGRTDRIGIFSEGKNRIRFLHQQTFTEIDTYKDIVLYIMLLKRPIVVRIQSKEAASAARKFFETMWTQAKP